MNAKENAGGGKWRKRKDQARMSLIF